MLLKLLYTLDSLGILYHQRGKLPESESESGSMYLRAVADSKAILEINHVVRLQIYLNLEFLYFDQGR